MLGLVNLALAETGIRKVVVASTTGTTTRYAVGHTRGKKVRRVIIPHHR